MLNTYIVQALLPQNSNSQQFQRLLKKKFQQNRPTFLQHFSYPVAITINCKINTISYAFPITSIDSRSSILYIIQKSELIYIQTQQQHLMRINRNPSKKYFKPSLLNPNKDQLYPPPLLHSTSPPQNAREDEEVEDSVDLDVTALKDQYEKALELVREGSESSKQMALKMLYELCMCCRDVQEDNKIINSILENAVKNYLKLKSMLPLKTHQNKEQQLEFIRHFTTHFQNIYQRNQKSTVTRDGLALLFLIQANQQYQSRAYQEALESCQKSIRYCSGSKSQIDIHLMKVQYVKSSIYEILKDDKNELQSVNECLKLINRLTGTIPDRQTNEGIANLKKTLIDKKSILTSKQHNNSKEPVRPRKSSLNKFRTRSISLKKSGSQTEIAHNKTLEKPQKGLILERSKIESKRAQNKFDSTHLSKTAQHSKHLSVQFQQLRQNQAFIQPKKRTQLKKRALRLELKEPAMIDPPQLAVDEIENERPVVFQFQELMVQRPKPKKSDKSQEKNRNMDNSSRLDEVPALMLDNRKKKVSEEQQSSLIEPVTHFLKDSRQNELGQMDNEYQELVWQCIRQQEENIIKGYIKSYFPKESEQTSKSLPFDASDAEYFKKTTTKIKQSLQKYKKDQTQGKSYQNLCPLEKKLNFTRVRESILSNNQQLLNEERQIYSYSNHDFDISENLGLCTAFGYLSKFNLKLKILGYSQEEGQKEENRVVLIEFQAILNEVMFTQVELKYQLQNSYESDIYVILYELNKSQIPQQDIPEQIGHRLFTIIVNHLILLRKITGTVLAPKKQQLFKRNTIVEEYKRSLTDRLINYEMNNLSNQFFSPKGKKSMINQERQKKGKLLQKQHQEIKAAIEAQENEEEEGIDTFSNYLPNLEKKLTEDCKDDNSSVSSRHRMKTDRMFKNTLFSYKSTMKSIDFGQFNLYVRDEDIKSLNLAIMPSEFHSKISKYFEKSKEGKEGLPFEQFYYCMKFVLIRPENNEENSFIDCFYDKLVVECLHCLNSKIKVRIKMTCFKAKEIFRTDNEIFYKFEISFIREKLKAMKFITTSRDLKLVEKRGNSKSNKLLENDFNARSSRKRHPKQKDAIEAAMEEAPIEEFKEEGMLILLKKLSEDIIVEKSYIYSMVGFENKNGNFNYINKFRLEGRTIQGKSFLISHLKQIHIFFQKSIKIKCECFKWFAVLTVLQIIGSQEFSLIFYIPKLQRTYTVTLTRNIVSYLSQKELESIFGSSLEKQQILAKLFKVKRENSQTQRQIWNKFSNLLQFESRYMDDRIQILLRIGSYCAFLKDASFVQYFDLDKKIYRLQMSLSKKGQPLTSEKDKHKYENLKLVKRKSSSTKEIYMNKSEYNETNFKPQKKRNIVAQKDALKEGESKGLQRMDFFDHFNEIYQSDIPKYMLYITLSEMLEINEDADNNGREPTQPKKINFAFQLSDLSNLLKKNREELKTLGLSAKVQFNEQVFSFALLLRMMTVIKHRIIKQLKQESLKNIDLIQELFEGANSLECQKIFKNQINEAFNSVNENHYSLNAFKCFRKLEKNIFVVHKNIMNTKKNELVCFLYNELERTMTIFLSNSHSLESRERVLRISSMRFPWISFLKNTDLITVNKRLYSYYRNVLLAS